jgi:VanZ family protein
MSAAVLRRAARAACWAVALAILAASVVPGEIRAYSPFNGLVEHFLAYFAMGLTLEFGYGDRLPRGTFAVLLVGVAAALEIVQAYAPDRHPAVVDFLANAGGALTGVGFAVLIGRFVAREP